MDKDPTIHLRFGLTGFEASGTGQMSVLAVALVAIAFIILGLRLWKRPRS